MHGMLAMAALLPPLYCVYCRPAWAGLCFLVHVLILLYFTVYIWGISVSPISRLPVWVGRSALVCAPLALVSGCGSRGQRAQTSKGAILSNVLRIAVDLIRYSVRLGWLLGGRFRIVLC